MPKNPLQNKTCESRFSAQVKSPSKFTVDNNNNNLYLHLHDHKFYRIGEVSVDGRLKMQCLYVPGTTTECLFKG